MVEEKDSLPDVTQYFDMKSQTNWQWLKKFFVLTIFLITFQRNVLNNSYVHQKADCKVNCQLHVAARIDWVHFVVISACKGKESAYTLAVTILGRAEH